MRVVLFQFQKQTGSFLLFLFVVGLFSFPPGVFTRTVETFSPTRLPPPALVQNPCQRSVPPCVGVCKEVLGYILQQRKESLWNTYYEDVVQGLLKHNIARSTPALVVEIGTAFGGLATHLLSRLPLLSHTAVDPFIPYDEEDGMSKILKKIQDENGGVGSSIWAQAMMHNMTSMFGCRYTLEHGRSVQVAKDRMRFPEGLVVDAVFIDGDHRYDGVEADIAAWRTIVRPDGLLIFNDYSHDGGGFPGVKAMVDAHAKMTNQDVEVIGLKERGNVLLLNRPFLVGE